MAKHWLITGGTGFIGRALCDRILHETEDKITVLTRTPAKYAQSIQKNRQFIGSLEALSSEVNHHKIDYVVNLAGEPIAHRWTKKKKSAIWDSRVTNTQKLIAWLKEHNQHPEVFIQGSAVGVYGNKGDEICTEKTELITKLNEQPDFPAQLCAAWEAVSQNEQEKTRLCIIRTGIVLGKNGGILAKMLPAFKWGFGGRLGDGKQYLSWITLTDYINLILFLVKNNSCQGAYNGVSTMPVTNSVFSSELAKVLHRPCWAHMPSFIVKLLFGEMGVSLLLASQRVQPARLLEAGFEFQHTDLHQALADLNLN